MQVGVAHPQAIVPQRMLLGTKALQPRLPSIPLAIATVRQADQELDQSQLIRGQVLGSPGQSIQEKEVAMKKWLFFGGLVLCLGFTVVTFKSRRSEKMAPQRLGQDFQITSSNHNEPVGWVFGRMVGFPGADKPLLPQSGGFGRQMRIPPTVSVHP